MVERIIIHSKFLLNRLCVLIASARLFVSFDKTGGGSE